MDYIFHIMVISGIYTILAMSLNLIIGYTGLSAFGHIAFAAIGAYTSSISALDYCLSPWIGIFLGALIAALLGLLIGLSSIRLKDDYLALATFGFGIIVYSVAQNWTDMTRGPIGLPGIPQISIMGFQIQSTMAYLMLVVIVVILTTVIINRIVYSPYGRILKSIRDDEIVSLSLGNNVNKYKLTVFVIGAFFAGIAGSLYAHYISFIDPSNFTAMESITVLLMVVFGGMGSLQGSFIGATIIVVLPEIMRFLGLPSSVAAPLRQMLYGLLLIVLMIKRPQGIIGKITFR